MHSRALGAVAVALLSVEPNFPFRCYRDSDFEGVNNAGAVYYYTREGSTWTLQQRLEASDGPSVHALFGSSVSLHGSRLLIGAEQMDIDGTIRQGAGYISELVDGVGVETDRLTAASGQMDSHFGRSCALQGDRALIGARLSFGGDNLRGVVHEFRLGESAWSETQLLSGPQGQGLDSFGFSTAVQENRLIVGSPDNLKYGGAAWLFTRPPLFEDGFESGDSSGWSQTVGAGPLE